MNITRKPLITSLFILTILGTTALAITPAASAVTGGTGTLFIYSDSSCSTLLSQSGGIKGYVLPATGTTVYIKITGITEVPDGPITILLQFSGETNEFIAGTVSGGTTNCIAWVVGTFGGALQDTPSTCATGIVRYGPALDTTVSDFYSTNSNGGSDGGHFYWGNGLPCTPLVTSELPLVGTALAGAVMLGGLALYMRTGRKFRSVIPK